MKIKKVVLTNFRGYRNPTEIGFNDLSVFVGLKGVGWQKGLEGLSLGGCFRNSNPCL